MTDEPVTLEYAWRIHAAQGDWTARVDAKASFALTIESALLAGVISLSQGDGALANLDHDGPLWLFRIGTGLIILGVLLSMYVVAPHLRAIHLKEEAKGGAHIYFGHARYHSPADQADLMRNAVDTVDGVAAQVVRMAGIAWRKHVALLASLIVAPLGALLVSLASSTN